MQNLPEYILKMDPQLSTSPDFINVFFNRKSCHWVEDRDVSACLKCGLPFSYLYWRPKHHCRVCLKIYCDACSSRMIEIPKRLKHEKHPHFEYTGKDRVCDFCFNEIETVKSVDILIDVFRLLKLDIKDFKNLLAVSRTWNKAASYFISKFTSLQKRMFNETLSDIDQEIIKNNKHYFTGHRNYCFTLLKFGSAKKFCKIFNATKITTCQNLNCTQHCTDGSKITDAVIILYLIDKRNIKNEELLEYGLEIISNHLDQLQFYLRFLVRQLISFNSKRIYSFLIEICEKKNMIERLYWELKSQNNKSFLKKIKIYIKRTGRTHIIESQKKLIYTIKEGRTDLNSKVISPLNNSITINKIKEYTKTVSNSSPSIVVFNNGEYSFLAKQCKDTDLKNDQLMVQLISICNLILKTDLNIDYNVVEYGVLPLKNRFGLVEIVNNASTLYTISKELNTSITNYIFEDDRKIISEVRNTFIRSTAFYCVISYLFGIGDRTLRNIMVTKDGRLFHIDFEHIFGDDPKSSCCAQIRVTDEIIEAIGGKNSKKYKEFNEHIVKIYTHLVKYADFFIAYIFTDGIEKRHKNELIKKFYPSIKNTEDGSQIIYEVENQPVTELIIKDFVNQTSVGIKSYTNYFMSFVYP